MKYISVWIDNRTEERFDAMVETQAWGDGKQEVLSSIVHAAIRDAIEGGLIALDPIPKAEVEEAPQLPVALDDPDLIPF